MTFPDERRLLADIGQTYERLDPVPPDVLQAARGALSWRTLDAELAELTTDSRTGSPAGSTGPPRRLRFQCRTVTVELVIVETGQTRHIAGQLLPPAAAQVAVRSRGGEQGAEADAGGRFDVAAVPCGPVSVLCRLPAAERPVVTSWVVV
jgi:hypothetical protein